MSETIESVLQEKRVFEPDSAFSAAANVGSFEEYERLYRRSVEDPEGYWAEAAGELHWFKPWDTVLEWDEPFAKWFSGGETNASYNCLDLQIERGLGDKVAFYWEGEPGDRRRITYSEMLREVSRFAGALKSLGVKKGDRVVIYLPLILEGIIAMLACARIGALHSVVFGGFSANALTDRIADTGARFVITADGGYRRGAVLPLKPAVDEALKHVDTVEHVIVVKRAGNEIDWQEGRDHWLDDVLEGQPGFIPAEPVEAEHPLYVLYTSGSTGKPKGVLHTTGGYQVYAQQTSRQVFDLKPNDVFWCTADIGWVTGHSYTVYGPMANGATQVIYEGVPTQPHAGRMWEMIERYGVTIYYTAPTAIRAFMKLGEEHPAKYDLSSLRLLGSVGEPINPEAWMWYRRVIGGGNVPVVDTWWQTETGGIMISTLPGAMSAKPGSAGLPLPGIVPDVVDADGNPPKGADGGFLVIRRPWPGMLRTVWGNDERYRDQYWSQVKGSYFAGDGCRRDSDGYYWIMGRVDDVVNVSGHRLGTMEIESALVSHPLVAEAAVVGRPDDLKGQAIVAFVSLEGNNEGSDDLVQELRNHVAVEIGAIAKPDEIRFAASLPKTRSGKIMRRLLRNIAAGEDTTGDTSTLEDRSVVDALLGRGG